MAKTRRKSSDHNQHTSIKDIFFSFGFYNSSKCSDFFFLRQRVKDFVIFFLLLNFRFGTQGSLSTSPKVLLTALPGAISRRIEWCSFPCPLPKNTLLKNNDRTFLEWKNFSFGLCSPHSKSTKSIFFNLIHHSKYIREVLYWNCLFVD